MGNHGGNQLAEKDGAVLTRRRILQGAGGFFAAAAFPDKRAMASVLPLRQDFRKAPSAAADITGRRQSHRAKGTGSEACSLQ